MSKRIFYVVIFDNPRLQKALDTMKCIANPDAKSTAHITIRGPYLQRVRVKRIEEIVRSIEIFADGAGAFFDGDQNTVFIRCWSEHLHKVWKKRDFGFNPHITIYDGRSRVLAAKLLDRIQRLSLGFGLGTVRLRTLQSCKGQQTMWRLRHAFDEEFVFRTVGEQFSVSDIEAMTHSRRAQLIEALAKKLPDLAASGIDTSGNRPRTDQVEPASEIALTTRVAP